MATRKPDEPERDKDGKVKKVEINATAVVWSDEQLEALAEITAAVLLDAMADAANRFSELDALLNAPDEPSEDESEEDAS